jgi:hypothetical protein
VLQLLERILNIKKYVKWLETNKVCVFVCVY